LTLTENHAVCADKLFTQCGRQAILEVRRELTLIRDKGEITKHGINFCEEKDYLEHMQDHAKHAGAIYLRNSSIAKQLHTEQQRHVQLLERERGLELSL
jgi:hypothetical protein